MGTSSDPFLLRQLSLPTRLVLSLFLISVGFGYFSALVQLHFNGGAKAGEPLPDAQDAVDHYSGHPGMSTLERLITADESKPFNASGSMRAAFTTRSSGWGQKIIDRAKDKRKARMQGIVHAGTLFIAPGMGDPLVALARLALDAETVLPADSDEMKKVAEPDLDEEKERPEAVRQLRAEREVERRAMVAWIHDGARKENYDSFPLPADLLPDAGVVTDDKIIKVERGADGKVTKAVAHVNKIMNTRCVRCHYADATGPAGQIDLDRIEVVRSYAQAESGNGGGMSLTKLAQSTHVHLLGFSMLYGLTGLLFSFTSYPGMIRCVFGPFTLIAQLADISCWWLARADPLFAQMIVVTGGCVALGLGIQIVGTLFDLYNLRGKLVLVALLAVTAAGGGVVIHKVVHPHLEREKATVAASVEVRP